MKESIKVRLKQLQRITGRIFRSRLLVLRGGHCGGSGQKIYGFRSFFFNYRIYGTDFGGGVQRLE